MELQFEKTVCRYLDQAVREVREQEQTQEIRLSDGMPDIGRVIAAWGQVIIRSKEWRSDSVILSGGIMVWVLYAPEDGTEHRCLEEWLPFRMKWDLPEDAREGQMRASCLLRFVDGRNVSPRKIMVRCGVSGLMEALSPSEAELYMPGQMKENVQLLKRTYPVRLFKEAGEKAFVLDEDLTLPGSCPKPQRLLYCTVQPEITERKVMVDKVVFRGNGNLHILYRSEEGQLHTWDFELPFSQLAQLQENYSADARADIWMCVTSLETELDSEGHLRVKYGMVGQYLVDDRTMVELVEDAYSLARDLTTQPRELEMPTVLENRTENIYGEQMIQTDANVVVDCVFLPDFPRSRRTDSGIEMELPGLFQVLCYGENGELKSGTARWEGSLQLVADEECRVNTGIRPQGRPQSLVGDGSVTVSGEAVVMVESISRRGLPMVTGLELGEPREPDPGRPSLILRRAGADELWTLAKQCGSTVEVIRNANGLQEEPGADRLLLIPVS